MKVQVLFAIGLFFPSWYSVHAELETLKIGTLSALTGYSAKQGVPCKNAFEISLKTHTEALAKAGYSVELVFGDSQRLAGPAVTELTRMLHTDHVIGALICGSPVGMGVNPISKREKIPVIGAVGHKDFLPQNPYAYGIWPATEAEATAIANKVISDNKTRVAIITAEDDWALALRDGFLEGLVASKISIVMNEEVPREETSFSSLLARLRAAQPDAIYVNVVLGNSGILMRRIREMGIDATMYANYFASTEAELAAAGPAAEGVVITQVDYDADKLRTLYKEHGYGEVDPNTIAYTCFSSAELLVKALEMHPAQSESRVHSGETLKAALDAVDEIQMLGGRLPIEDRRAKFSFSYTEHKLDGAK